MDHKKGGDADHGQVGGLTKDLHVLDKAGKKKKTEKMQLKHLS